MVKYSGLSEWKLAGLPLGSSERRLMWQIGDWWLAGQVFGPGVRKQIVTSPGWRGPTYDSCRVAGSIARQFAPTLRRLNVPFTHHQAVAPLPRSVALRLLDRADRQGWTQNRIRLEVGRIRYFVKPSSGDIVGSLEDLIAAGRKFRAILADPPWEIWTTTNRRGGSDRFYDSMSVNDIAALPVQRVSDDGAFLFLWCPAVCLPDALAIMSAWRFSYVTNLVWDKQAFGTGYYFRMAHELLLLGRRPNAPTHFLDRSISSVLRAPRTAHSEKPEIVHKVIERATEGPFLEMFARRAVAGWTSLGDQLAKPDYREDAAD